jgi:hypothetical protein
MIVEGFGGCSPAEGLSGTAIEFSPHGFEGAGAMLRRVRAFRKVLTQKTVGVLIGSALPWAVRVAEVDRQSGVDAKLGTLGHFGAMVQGQ